MRQAEPETKARFLSDAEKAPELARALAAFHAGNYALVRIETARVLAEAQDESVKSLALELQRRTQPDPLLRYLLVVSFVLLAIVTVFAYVH
jgi:hypothetical protein